MATDAFDMFLIHEVFRKQLSAAPALIRGVVNGDSARSRIVSRHVAFLLAALHHHHMAEDDVLWPKLLARVPEQKAVVARMAAAHHTIANTAERIQTELSSWVCKPESTTTERLAATVDELSSLVDEHLTDEEVAIVPLINIHIDDKEWREATARGAAFMSRRNARLALVLGGMVLEGLSIEDRQRFLATVPLAPRLLLQLLAGRTYARYRMELRG